MTNIALWINTVVEFGLAVGMFSVPTSFFPGADQIGSNIARAFSFALLAVSFISLTALKKNVSPETKKYVIGILIFYHFAQLIAQFVNYSFLPPLLIPPVIIHTLFTAMFLVVWQKMKTQ